MKRSERAGWPARFRSGYIPKIKKGGTKTPIKRVISGNPEDVAVVLKKNLFPMEKL